MVALTARKSYEKDAKKAVALGREDVNKVERSFKKVYTDIEGMGDSRERQRRVIAFDLMEGWIMDYWSQCLKEDRPIAIEDLTDSLKATISGGRQQLEDGFLNLKLRFNHVDCDWTRDSTMEANIGRFVKDPMDVPHVSMAACYARKNSARAIYVTNDAGVLARSTQLLSRFNVVATRPAFAYAYSLD
jgi:hypothetical protein